MNTTKFPASIVNGRLTMLNERAFGAHVKGFEEGERLDVTVTRRARKRTLPQNAWYWSGVLPIIAQHTGHSVDELHEIFKRKFLPPVVITYRGEAIRMPGSTSGLDTAGFSEYVERIRAEAGMMGISVPNPEDHFT